MGKVKLWVDGTQIEAEEGQSVLNAALAAAVKDKEERMNKITQGVKMPGAF